MGSSQINELQIWSEILSLKIRWVEEGACPLVSTRLQIRTHMHIHTLCLSTLLNGCVWPIFTPCWRTSNLRSECQENESCLQLTSPGTLRRCSNSTSYLPRKQPIPRFTMQNPLSVFKEKPTLENLTTKAQLLHGPLANQQHSYGNSKDWPQRAQRNQTHASHCWPISYKDGNLEPGLCRIGAT